MPELQAAEQDRQVEVVSSSSGISSHGPQTKVLTSDRKVSSDFMEPPGGEGLRELPWTVTRHFGLVKILYGSVGRGAPDGPVPDLMKSVMAAAMAG